MTASAPYSAGLLGFRSFDGAPPTIGAALARSPWRGTPTASHVHPVGEVHALARASAARSDGVALVLHGRIDRLPGGHSDLTRTMSSPDVCLALIEAYRRDGPAFVDRLTGDHALVLVDERRRLLFAARDWIGARPLFCGSTAHGVAVASEPAQVLALLGEPHRIDEDVLATWARGDAPPLDATFDRLVRAVPPGGRLLAGPDEVRRWRQPVRFAPIAAGPDEAAAAVRAALETAVHRRTVGAEHLGALVSGGLDSTSVAAVAASLARRGAGPPLALVLTAAFSGTPACDETAYARALADHWSVPWRPVEIPAADFAAFAVRELGRHLGPVFPTFPFFARLAVAARADGVDVLLTGQGADAWLAQDGHELRLSALRGDLAGVASWGRRRVGQRPRSAASQLYRGLAGRLVRGRRAEELFEGRIAFVGRHALEAEEREAMLRGVRVEFPFADRDLAGLLSGLRPSVRSTPAMRKRVMREATVGLLPDIVRLRTSRTEFGPWLTRALGLDLAGAELLRSALGRAAADWRDGVALGEYPVPSDELYLADGEHFDRSRLDGI